MKKQAHLPYVLEETRVSFYTFTRKTKVSSFKAGMKSQIFMFAA